MSIAVAADPKPLKIGDTILSSRLFVGTGKYIDFAQTQAAIKISGAQVVTFALQRINIGQHKDVPNLLDFISPEEYFLLPNTAGCYTADEAVRTAHIAKELLNGHNWIKLEILGDQKTLFPDIIETLKAAEKLVAQGFVVLVYTSDDPLIAKTLENIGCAAVMPLAAPIGSGLGVCNPYNLQLILEEATVPIIVDAGVGTASDAAIAMELGCDGILMNTAIAQAKVPVQMAEAMRHAVIAGRHAFLAGRMPRRRYAQASSPLHTLHQ